VLRAPLGLVRNHPALTAVLAVFVASMFIVNTRANVTMLDDWIYIHQAKEFALHLRLHVYDQTAANGIFDSIWGGVFGMVLGTQLWVFRFSTLVLALIGGIGAYALGRELGGSKNASACGAALVLFNPVYFSLSYSFMTDVHCIVPIILSAYAYVRSLRDDQSSGRWMLAGSALAAVAYLSRPQAALIPLAVVAFFVATRRLRIDRAGLATLLRLALVPGVVILVHRGWLRWVNGVPHDQANFVDEFGNEAVRDLVKLTWRLGVSELMYVGLFSVPIALGALGAIRGIVRKMGRRAWIGFGLFAAALVIVVARYHSTGWRMPYLPEWFSQHGLGDIPLHGVRTTLLDGTALDLLVVASVVGILVLGLFAAQRLDDPATNARPQAALLVAFVVAMILGAIPPSVPFQFVEHAPSLDRYLLPAITLGIVLGVWALQGVRLNRVLATAGLAVMVAFSISGTRDAIEMQSAIWDVGHYANSIGIRNNELDGGAAYTRHYVALHRKPVALAPGADNPWWVGFDERTSARYAVSYSPVPGYRVVRRFPVSQWLAPEQEYLYLLEVNPPG
jgi:hypothetical protein